MENGANVNERYGFLRSTGLMKAVDKSDKPLVSFLLQQPGTDVNAKDIDGNAALHHIHVTNETATKITKLLLNFPGIDTKIQGKYKLSLQNIIRRK